ncbi:kinesin KIF15 [Labeo rohita]|uniref:Kinesin KIF15 n=1 Tax=Labeo rohita TaxID=84645 RepID=A0A498MFY7_LABRO|nr:kinesin KIF15 [Labeo rohita]
MMTTRGKSEGCRICGSDLQGSTLSLSSSRSLSKSHGLLTPTKGIDLLCVLTHILEQPVPRGNGQGEFLCGKCVSVLERVFKFDTVISRVRVLSSERLQKLSQERDKIRRWVRNMYEQRHPSTFRRSESSSEDEGDRKYGVGEGYREMLRDNMALSEYEWWSEKAETCPYYRRTGKRCHKGKKCECCDSLRVSDSDYESVCGIPRHLPDQAFMTLGLSREKSCSMPLHWSKVPSVRSSPASLSGSCRSLRSQSRTSSVQSLDSLDGNDPFDWPEEHSAILDTVFKELRGIEGKPVRSPSGSRIPVLDRGGIQNGKDEVGLKAGLVRVLNFGEGDNGMEDEFEDESADILTELKDDFMPLQRESSASRVHLAVKQLREQLVQAQARIRTLEAQLRDGNKSTADAPAKQLKSPQVSSLKNKNDLIESLSQSLHSRENIIQECVTLIQKLCAEQGLESQDTDKLIKKLASAVPDTRSEREAILEAQLSEAGEREKALEKQLQAMRDAGRERDRDFITLNTVLQCNQDVINHLRLELAERDRAQQEMMKEWEVWKERDSALTALVKENKDYISHLKEALESSRRDVQALSDSLIGRGLEGSGAEAGLVNQLREKEALLAVSFRDREELSTSMLQEISRLSSALTDAESIILEQRENHKQAITALSGQLKDTLKELREKTKEKKEAELGWKKENKERAFEEGKLRDNLQKRDKLIELTSAIISGPFPPPALRDQSAVASTGMAGEYMRGVREVEGHLRRQAGRVTQEGTRVEHQRERLEKLLRSLRKALLVNQQSADGRTFRPATTETIQDGADDLLLDERRGLNVLKQELENMLRKTLTQQQVLAGSSKQLLDCAFERSRVTELLPQHGSLSAGVKTYPCPLSLKPDPAGPFTPECKQALDSSSTVLHESQQLRENISQVMSDVIRKQTDMHRSASEALLRKITETINLEQHLTLSSAATKQAIYRKQRQMQCAGYSLGRAMGSTMLRKHLETSGKEIAELQVAHRQLEDDKYGKRAAASVDSAVVRLRRRLVRPQSVRPATS